MNNSDLTVYYTNPVDFDDFRTQRLNWLQVESGDSAGAYDMSGSPTRQPLAGSYLGWEVRHHAAAAKTSVVDYGSMGEAIDSLNANGIFDDVTFEIVAGLVEDQVVINYFPSYTSSGDSVLIKPEAGPVEWNIDRSGSDSLLQTMHCQDRQRSKHHN